MHKGTGPTACAGRDASRVQSILSRLPCLAGVALVANGGLFAAASFSRQQAWTLAASGGASIALGLASLPAASMGLRRLRDGSLAARTFLAAMAVASLAVGVASATLVALIVPGGTEALRIAAAIDVSASVAAMAATVPFLNPTALVFVPAALVCTAELLATGERAETLLGGLVAAVTVAALAACVLLSRRIAGAAEARAKAARAALDLDLVSNSGCSGDRLFFWSMDATGRFASPSAAMTSEIGLHAGQIAGATLGGLVATRSRTKLAGDAARAVMSAVAARQAFQDAVIEVPTTEGSLWWRLSGRPLHDALGVFVGFGGIGADITRQREADARIAFLSGHDPLTGFVNRTRLAELVSTRLGEPAARRHALLYLDLHGFADINARFGREAGDRVIETAAARWRARVPKSAVAARIGGDEFAVFYAPREDDHAETVAEIMLCALREPFDNDGAPIELDGAIGIAYADASSHPTARTLDVLIDMATIALQQAKASERKKPVVFTGAIERSLSERKRLDEDMKLALARGEFELHYQPLLDLASGTIVSFEALIRWRSPTRGFVSPTDFIPAAEGSGLIVAIGRWVLMQAARDAAGWTGEPKVAVNISPKHFRSVDFPADVRLALATSGLPPSRLEIEITEGIFFDSSGVAMHNLVALRERGVRIALDDFGTGYSSLNYLVDFPVDKLKIDRSFITGYLDKAQSRAIVDAILGLARKLSIRVTAEGVETLDQALALKLRHCDDIQGYLVSRPVAGDAVPALLADLLPQLEQEMPALFESRLAAVLAMKNRVRPAASA